jgi:hypothetical protein
MRPETMEEMIDRECEDISTVYELSEAQEAGMRAAMRRAALEAGGRVFDALRPEKESRLGTLRVALGNL